MTLLRDSLGQEALAAWAEQGLVDGLAGSPMDNYPAFGMFLAAYLKSYRRGCEQRTRAENAPKQDICPTCGQALKILEGREL